MQTLISQVYSAPSSVHQRAAPFLHPLHNSHAGPTLARVSLDRGMTPDIPT